MCTSCRFEIILLKSGKKGGKGLNFIMFAPARDWVGCERQLRNLMTLHSRISVTSVIDIGGMFLGRA